MQSYQEKYAISDDEEKLFRYLEEGENSNVPSDLIEAARNRDVESLCKVGGIYFSQGDDDSLRRAFQLYKIASDLNYSEAQYLLGRCYMNAWGVPKADHEIACHMFSLAGSKNHPESLYKFGFIFHYGLGRPQSYSNAKILYQEAVKLNEARAEYNLGVIYECGLGVKVDLSIATTCYKKSAEKGFFLATECLESIEKKKGAFACFKPKKKFTHNLDAIEILEETKRISSESMRNLEVEVALHNIGYRFDKSKPLLDIDLVIMVLELANRNKALVNLKKTK